MSDKEDTVAERLRRWRLGGLAPSSRRNLAAIGLGGAALLASQESARADTAFTNFSYLGRGCTANRTTPDRIGDILNVMDFGAKGDGSTDDTTSIQAAVNALQSIASTEGNGTAKVFFPPTQTNTGYYKITAPITIDPTKFNECIIEGSGIMSPIVGNFDDYIFTDRVYAGGTVSSGTVSGSNSSTGGSGTYNATITSAGVMTLNSTSAGSLTLGQALSGSGLTNNSYVETLLSGSLGANGSTYQCWSYIAHGVKRFSNLYLANTGSTNKISGGIRLSSAVVAEVRGCIFSGNFGVNCSGSDHNIVQGSFSVGLYNCKFNPRDLWPGLAGAGSFAVYINENSHASCCDIGNGFDTGILIAGAANSVVGGRCEVCTTGVLIGQLPDGTKYTASGCKVEGMSFESNFVAIDCYSLAGGHISGIICSAFKQAHPYAPPNFGTVASTTFTRTPGGATFMGSIATGATFGGQPAGTVTVSSGSAPIVGDVISWAGMVSPAYVQQTGPILVTGVPKYGVRQRGNNTTITAYEGITCSGDFSQATFSVNDPGVTSAARTFNAWVACKAANSGAANGVTWEMPTSPSDAAFVECNATAEFLFANLPSGAGNVFVGDEYNISNSNVATFGSTAAGGGSNHVRVRWNGTNWTVCGA